MGIMDIIERVEKEPLGPVFKFRFRSCEEAVRHMYDAFMVKGLVGHEFLGMNGDSSYVVFVDQYGNEDVFPSEESFITFALEEDDILCNPSAFSDEEDEREVAAVYSPFYLDGCTVYAQIFSEAPMNAVEKRFVNALKKNALSVEQCK